jgi:formiminotetrahydrofolate cyclodeaminase
VTERPAHTAAAGGLELLTLSGLLDALEAPAPSPCGGSAAALSGAMGASLVVLAARRAGDWDEAGGAAAQGVALRERLVRLAEEDARAYAAAMEALAAARGAGGDRDRLLGLALERAADVPLAIAAATADLAELAAATAEHAPPSLRPDAVTAVLLAESACRSCARLVEVNLSVLPDDGRVAEARALAAAAAQARSRALEEAA